MYVGWFFGQDLRSPCQYRILLTFEELAFEQYYGSTTSPTHANLIQPLDALQTQTFSSIPLPNLSLAV